jgi:hypothetical protein
MTVAILTAVTMKIVIFRDVLSYSRILVDIYGRLEEHSSALKVKIVTFRRNVGSYIPERTAWSLRRIFLYVLC